MTKETLAFQSEMKELMGIIVHSLYSNRDIFLRELISNAADAIDKVRFEGITNADVLEGNEDWKIELIRDKEAGTLTISDNGIGMDKEAIIANLGTVARSGTKEFLAKLQEAEAKDRPELIGQFGMGFYSAFMVADKISVHSRMAGNEDTGVRWESDGQGEFSVEILKKATRGTDVVLYLKEDMADYLEEWTLKRLVSQYSNFIEHPVVMTVEKTTGEGDDKKTEFAEETLNSRQAIWQRPKDEVSEEEHKEFFNHLNKFPGEIANTIHVSLEGGVTFKALLYLPKQRPFDFLTPEQKGGLSLYIKRVFIMDEAKDLLPQYLRFVVGVVDAADLPLNVSREILQQNKVVDTIRKSLTSKVLKAIKDMRDKDPEVFAEFYKAFSPVLKEGVQLDYANRDKIIDLLQWETAGNDPGKAVTLNEYVDAMPANQKAIYYLVGESRDGLASSPYLEGIRAKGQDVFLMTDPIDEFIAPTIGMFRDKPLKAADKGELAEDDGEEKDEKKDEQSEEFEGILSFLKHKIGEVKDVRLSNRLTDSAAVLVAEDHEMGAYVEELVRKMGDGAHLPDSKRTLELNAKHPVVMAMRNRYDEDPSDTRLEDYGRLLYDQAVLAEGRKIEDPAAFAKRLNAVMAREMEAAK